jgi:uncharacterized tellurite resistance protein B-like protein
MIDRLRAWLAEEGDEPTPAPDELQLAVAALLIEAAQVDDRFDASERSVIEGLLERRFGLAPAEARALAEKGGWHADQAVQLLGFARTVNERLGRERRVELVEMLWEVAYADGTLDPLEDTLLRRIGGLIDVPDKERGAARLRVLKRLGISQVE